MTTDAASTAARHEAIQTLVEHWTPRALAAFIVDALAVAGGTYLWNNDTVHDIVAVLNNEALPDVMDDTYWRHILTASRVS